MHDNIRVKCRKQGIISVFNPILPEGNRLSVSDPLELRRDAEVPSGNCRSIFRDRLVLNEAKTD